MYQKSIVKRFAVYILGLLLLATGTSLAMNSGLGLSPVNSLPYTISLISGVSMFWCVITVYAIYIVAQFVILRKVRPAQLLQIVFSIVFSYLLELVRWVMGSLTIPTYVGSLAMTVISAVVVGIGVALYTGARIVPMPMEGLALAIAERTGKQFSAMKNVVDCGSVALSLVLSLLLLGGLGGVREGTVISALLVGRVVGLWNYLVSRRERRESDDTR
ncbi:MAG: DUF6198 family protein [Oscillospiraceae bacterium]|nr:DUF6198 family protein [Oscillospiraceae bacterium]